MTEIQDFPVAPVIEESREKTEFLVPQVLWERKAHPEVQDPQDYLVIRDLRENGEILACLDPKGHVADLVQLAQWDR